MLFLTGRFDSARVMPPARKPWIKVLLHFCFAADPLDSPPSRMYRHWPSSPAHCQPSGGIPCCGCAQSLRYVRHAFEINEGLRTQLAAARENPLIYEVSITDTDGTVLASTEESHQGKFLQRRASLSQLVSRSFLHQMKVLLGPKNPQLFEVVYPFISALLAAMVSGIRFLRTAESSWGWKAPRQAARDRGRSQDCHAAQERHVLGDSLPRDRTQ